MKAIITLFWQICRLRLGPEEVPASSVLLVVIGFLYGVLNLLAWVWTGSEGILEASATLAVITGGWLLVLWGIMLLMGKKARFQQTLIALFGVNCVLVLISMPLRFAADGLPDESGIKLGVGLLLVGVFVWGVFIEGFIYHRSLDISPLQGNLLALAMSMGIMALLGP